MKRNLTLGLQPGVQLLLAALISLALVACASPADSAGFPTNNPIGIGTDPTPSTASSTPTNASPAPPTDDPITPSSSSTPAATNLTPTLANDTQSGGNLPTATDTATSTPLPTQAANYDVNGNGDTNVEQAHAQLLAEGNLVYLIFVSAQSTGVEGQIYSDLVRRYFRTTTGPDEGIDTHGEFCYPNCVYVLRSAANDIGVAAWTSVLRHEYRHIIQAQHNPNLAQDFRDPAGRFTTYAAFEEACADYGLNVAPVYRAQARIDHLERVLGTAQASLDSACTGDMGAYQNLVDRYNQTEGANAFQTLFPGYN